MLLVEENHAGASTSTHSNNKMLYMEEDQYALEAANKRKIGGTRTVPTIVPNPPKVGVVRVVPGVGERRP